MLNLTKRSSTSQLYDLAEKLGLKDIIIIRKNLFNNVKNDYENIIINLDDEANGSHWCALNTKYKIYFDSYNQDPPKIVSNYKQANSQFEFQSLRSTFCGQISILFLYYLNKYKNNPNKGIKEFYKKFNDVYENL